MVRRCPGEHEIGHVDATDQEHEGRRPRQDRHERVEAAHELLQRRRDIYAPAPAALRVLPLDAHRNRRHLGPSLFDGNVVVEPTHHVVDTHSARIGERRVDGQRFPDLDILGPGWELEIRGHHTHHRIGRLTQVDDRADHLGGGFEALGPQAVGQNHDEVVAWCGVLFLKRAAQGGLHVYDLKDRGRDLGPGHGLSLALSYSEQGEGLEVVSAQCGEGLGAVHPVDERRRRNLILSDIGLRVGLPQRHDVVGFGVGQRPEQDAIHHAEDRGVDSDSQPQGRHHDQREAGVVAECPERKSDVLHKWKNGAGSSH